MLQRVAMQKHPILKHFKWALNIPGISHFADKKLYGHFKPKTAQLTANVLASVIGSTAAENAAAKRKAKAEADALIDAPKVDPSERVSDISLVADDPAARAYLKRNKRKIMAILNQMAAEGKI